MRTDRYAALNQSMNAVTEPGAPFQLDHLRARLHQAGAGMQRVVRIGEAHKRQVGHDQGVGSSPRHALRVVGHGIQRHRDGCVVALQHHAERVAHQNGVSARFARKLCESRIIGRNHDELVARGLHVVQGTNGDALCHCVDSLPLIRSWFSAKKSGVKVVPAIFNVQHVVNKLLIIPVTLCKVNLISIDDEQRR